MLTVTEKLLNWYRASHRKLPWRETSDPYRIWISEIMLQQTRVAAVIPYYERFLEKFPDCRSLAAAPEEDLLAAWAGLGYYSRARNLQRASRQMNGQFPSDYDAIRALPGVGDYTAAAIASIAHGLPYAGLDGNVLRVMSRLLDEGGDIGSPATRRRLQAAADGLLDVESPGTFNQAMMELGATVCLPRQPQCTACPIARDCESKKRGRQDELPVKLRRPATLRQERTMLAVRQGEAFLMWRRRPESPRLAGFWELPEMLQMPEAQLGETVGVFRHSITNHRYTIQLVEASVRRKPKSFRWVRPAEFAGIPVSTTARKAVALYMSKSGI